VGKFFWSFQNVLQVNEEKKFDKHTHEKVLVMLLILNSKNSQGIKRNCDRMQKKE
jgi:hypothetical protein